MMNEHKGCEICWKYYAKAVKVVRETQRCQAGFLQRTLGIGYALAAHIMDHMENEGIIGPMNGMKPRDVLIS